MCLTVCSQCRYADDCQFMDSDSPNHLNTLKQRVESTLETALNWFTQNRLKINTCKTELLVIKSRQRKIVDNFCIKFGGNDIKPSPHAKILGVYVDSALSWEKQVSQVCRRCYSVLFGLSKLRNKIPIETKKKNSRSSLGISPHLLLSASVGWMR